MYDRQYGIDPVRLAEYAASKLKNHDQGIEIAIVIGGGNTFLEVSAASNGMDRARRLYGM
jgi:uridylate kinase